MIYRTLRYLTTLFFAIAFLLPNEVNATHVMGANITYTCVSPGQYDVFFTLYRDCRGIEAEASITIDYRSQQCGINNSITLSRIAGPTDITPVCPGQATSCSGNGQYGVQRFLYKGTLNLPAGCGSDWILSWDLCCRNAAINTLSNPSNQGTYVETILNNTLSPCNSSPQFLNDPVPFYCTNSAVNYNHGVVDANGDSVVFSVATPFDFQGQPVTYAAGFSASNPLTTSGGFNLNPITGDITFTPTQQQIGVTAIRVDEYRNGVLIGSVTRDMQFIILNCNNALPTASGINGTNSFRDTVCAGSQISFNINSADANTADVVTMTWNNAITGASFTTTTANRPVGTFTWTPPYGTPQGNYSFTVKVEDNACPLKGSNTYSYTIYVKDNPNLPVDAGANQTICQGNSATLTATSQAPNATNYVWSDGVNTFPGATITVTPVSTTVYTVVLNYSDGCSSVDNLVVTVNNKPVVTIFPATATVCSGGSVQLTASSTTATNFTWSPGQGLSCTNCANPVASPATTTTYNVVATDNAGCTSDPTPITITSNTPPPSASCEVIYVTTNGTGDGTQQSPTNLGDALNRARCNNSWLKLATGVYPIDTAISNITSYTTIEGGYDATTWTKSSQPGITEIFRGTNNIEGLPNAPRLVAIYLNSVSYVRFQDITIRTADAPLSTGFGVSTYGIHLTNCSNYDLVRTQVIAGNAGQGASGTAGLNGVAGPNGGNASGRNGGAGGCGVSGCGGGGGRGGSNGAISGSNGQAGQPGQNGGGAGGLGGNGSTICAGGFIGIFEGTIPRPGNPGSAGANGNIGAVGPQGTFASGFFVPGGQGGNGTAGGNGLPGGGGGGAGGSGAFISDGGGGGGGGAGGSGGGGGTGGFGGGSSFGVYAFNNGASGNLTQANITAGTAGAGGTGGAGGAGGAGGQGGNGTTAGCDSDPTGRGGNGGNGGNGGSGGNGQPGTNARVYLDGGLPFATADTVFNLAAQQVITVSNTSCTNTQVTFNHAQGVQGNWNFGANATPPTAATSPANTSYTLIGRKNISFDNDNYTGFVNIAIDQASFIPEILTSATAFGVDSYFVCAGAPTTFQAVIAGATSYDWDFGGAISPSTYTGPQYQTFNGLVFNTPGEYQVRLRIFSDCCGFSPYKTVLLRVVPQPNVDITGPTVLCTGSDITLTATGAESYTWTPAFGLSSTTDSIVVATPSTTVTYTVIGTSANGQCTDRDSITITVSPTPLVTLTTVDATCGNNGSVTSNVAPQGTYTYVWNDSTASTTPNLNNVLSGTYTVTVTAVPSGCTAVQSAFVSPGTGLVAFVDSSAGTSCFAACNGFARVRPFNGVAPFNYLWSTGETTVSISNLCAGTYSVTVTGADQCFSVANVTITQSDSLEAEIRAVGNNLCSYSTAGYAWANGKGGQGPFTYNWGTTPAQDSSWAVGLANGTYPVTVTDRNGCSATTTVTITSPDSLQPNALVNNISCNNANDGRIQLRPIGGTRPYTIQWSQNPQLTDTLVTGLVPGNYTVTITDANGCTTTETFTITNPAALAVNPVFSNVKCNQPNTGFIATNPSGGTAPYTFSWTPSVTTSADSAINLGPGNYFFTVTDANNCRVTGNGSIAEPPSINVNPLVGTPNICFGKNDGTLTFSATGGTPALVFVVSNGVDSFTNSNGTFLNLPVGNYTARVRDAAGCDIVAGTYNIVAANPDRFTFDVDSTTCFGSFADGAITIVPVDATNTPYQYSINGAAYQDSLSFDSLDNGTYTIVIRNGNLCTDTFRVQVEEPLQYQATVSPVVDTVYLNLGETVQLDVTTQNVPSPQYVWTPNTGLSCEGCPSPVASPTVHTTYSVRVTSAGVREDCFVDATRYVYVAIKTVMPNVFTPNGDGKNDKFFPISNYEPQVKDFRIYNRWGQLAHDTPEGWDGTYKGADQPAGTYNYFIIYFEEDAARPGEKIERKVQGSVTLLR